MRSRPISLNGSAGVAAKPHGTRVCEECTACSDQAEVELIPASPAADVPDDQAKPALHIHAVGSTVTVARQAPSAGDPVCESAMISEPLAALGPDLDRQVSVISGTCASEALRDRSEEKCPLPLIRARECARS